MESDPVSGIPQIEKKFYILGDERVFHTKAPEYFSAIMKKVGIKGTYEPFLVKPGEIEKAVREIRSLNVAGANVTTPYKEAVIPYLDELSEGATIIGSVNTIVRKGDKLKGYNTNAIGFMDALKDAGFDAAGKSVLVFGTGGAARAVVFILNWVHATSILVTGRSQEKIQAIVNQIGGEAISMSALMDQILPVNLLINATSVSSPDEGQELAELVNRLQLSDCELVIDLNYGRSRNFWRDMAQSKGIRFMDGLSSLSNQARRTFSLWTGIEVKPEIVVTAIQDSTAAF
ncbi:MAG: shikimate dehydrogenase [Pseudomonadota bacterium]